MKIFVPIPVDETNALYLREQILSAEDTDTGISYEMSLTAAHTAIIVTMTRADGTVRKQIMLMSDLMSAWAVALEVDEEVPA